MGYPNHSSGIEIMTKFRRSTLAALALPLSLALVACGSDSGDGTGSETELRGDPIDPIAAPEGTIWSETAAETPEGGYVIGNPDAPLKVVEYASHTCPACANFSEQGATGMEAYVNTGVVSYEIRNQIHNVLDLTLAVLMRCSGPEAFHPLSHQVWGDLNNVMAPAQNNPEGFSAAVGAPPEQRYQAIAEAGQLYDFFAARGISRDQAEQCLANTDLAQQIIDNSEQQSEELDVSGTPTFFLNGRKLEESSWPALERLLQQAGAR
jgi:hypothetical protein